MKKQLTGDATAMRDVLLALREISEKLEVIDARLDSFDEAGIKRGAVAGAMSGAVSGAMLTVGMALVRATAGV